MALLPHDVIHPETQLNTRVRVDYVIDAAMARVKAAEHLRVGGIDDGVGPEAGDVVLDNLDFHGIVLRCWMFFIKNNHY